MNYRRPTERVKQRWQSGAIEEVTEVARRSGAHEEIRDAGQRWRHPRQRLDRAQRILERAWQLTHLRPREALRVLRTSTLDGDLGRGSGGGRPRGGRGG